jgi:hypothetical protein
MLQTVHRMVPCGRVRELARRQIARVLAIYLRKRAWIPGVFCLGCDLWQRFALPETSPPARAPKGRKGRL